ncbi:hypothetical protein [Zhihengliuella flava]|uniref:ABC-type polysaccharide/polyol phosphate transport system ATPase subunit n=1 Tax=Zhihengliuella flava TaxID=1285193 RepID=A0A931GE12_9MICC|nr:hypothetical protein [Zhihengliuella flava]MBG6083555.1 ABC-type polysaccharide/polyol phosphate transport system ATPase subunit [Zhihengliuella flava]
MTDQTPIHPHLVLHNVAATHTYGSGKTALEVHLGPLSVALFPGETVGIIGNRQDGVDLLIDLIVGSVGAASGRVFSRHDVVVLTGANTFDPQESLRFNLTSMGMAYKISGRALKRMIESVAIDADVTDLLGMTVGNVEEDVVQRARLHMGLALQRPVMVLHPASAFFEAIDDEYGAAHLDAFRESGGSVVMTAPEARVLMNRPDRILWMEDGQLVGEADPGRMRKMKAALVKAQRAQDEAEIRRIHRVRKNQIPPRRIVLHGAD